MQIGGLVKFSLIDYPGRPAAVVFTQGCNFACPYCHNPELVRPELFVRPLAEEAVLDFLKLRAGKLQGVVISGGEPTLQRGLMEFSAAVKRLGYALKLDTNGSNPGVLEKLFAAGLVDFVAMDLKIPLEEYSPSGWARAEPRVIRESMRLIRAAKIAHLFRTTLCSEVRGGGALARIESLLDSGESYLRQPLLRQPGKPLLADCPA